LPERRRRGPRWETQVLLLGLGGGLHATALVTVLLWR